MIIYNLRDTCINLNTYLGTESYQSGSPKILLPKATEICLDLTYFAEGEGLGHKINIFKPQTPKNVK